MADLSNSQNIKKAVLKRCGELDDGTSDFDSITMDYLNEVYRSVVCGGNEFGVDVVENWLWARNRYPIIITLEPKYDTGTVSLVNGSLSGTFSSAPTDSKVGWWMKIDSREEFFCVRSHTAGNTAFQLDHLYTDTTGATLSYELYKLDYELADDAIVVDSSNNKIDFYEAAGVPLVATLTAGVYSPTAFAAEVKSALETAGAETYTITFNSLTRKFTVAHGGAYLNFYFGTGTNAKISAAALLGAKTDNYTGAVTYSFPYSINAIERFISPMLVHKDRSSWETNVQDESKIHMVDFAKFQSKYPITDLVQGIPDTFTIIERKPSGQHVVRFNKYPLAQTRVEIYYIPEPRDMINNTNNEPLIPVSQRGFLVYAAAYFLATDKSDNKSQAWYQLAAAKLKSMVATNRAQLELAGRNFGQLIARIDQVGKRERTWLT